MHDWNIKKIISARTFQIPEQKSKISNLKQLKIILNK